MLFSKNGMNIKLLEKRTKKFIIKLLRMFFLNQGCYESKGGKKCIKSESIAFFFLYFSKLKSIESTEHLRKQAVDQLRILVNKYALTSLRPAFWEMLNCHENNSYK